MKASLPEFKILSSRAEIVTMRSRFSRWTAEYELTPVEKESFIEIEKSLEMIDNELKELEM